MIQMIIKALAYSAVFTALFACSSETTEVPAELETIEDPLAITLLWDKDVGTGDNDLLLQLEPFISGPDVFTVDVKGNVESRSSETGKLNWDKDLDMLTSGGISGDSQRLYLTNFQGEVISVSREDGSELWRSTLSSEALSSPVSDGSVVVVHASDGRVFGFNAATGDQKWRYDSDTPVLSLRGTSTPLIREDRAYVGLAGGDLIALSLADGRKVWSINLAIPSGRTELERLVDADGAFDVLYGTLYATAYQGDLKAVDVYSGSEKWAKPLSSYTGVAVSKNSGMVFSTDDEGRVYCFDSSTGKEVWQTEALLHRRLGTAVSWGNYAAVADFEGYVHVMDQQTGVIVGRVHVDSDGVLGQIKVVGSAMYVYTRSGDLYAYKLDS